MCRCNYLFMVKNQCLKLVSVDKRALKPIRYSYKVCVYIDYTVLFYVWESSMKIIYSSYMWCLTPRRNIISNSKPLNNGIRCMSWYVRTSMFCNSYQCIPVVHPNGHMTQYWRNDNVFITSKRRHRRRLDVLQTLLLRRVPSGMYTNSGTRN